MFPTSIVPYDWIEGINLYGNEFSCSPLIFCKFRERVYFWKKLLFIKYPYKKTVYYIKNPNYDENDIHSLEFILFREEDK